MGGKDVFYSFSSAKNTMFLRLFRSNGKEGRNIEHRSANEAWEPPAEQAAILHRS